MVNLLPQELQLQVRREYRLRFFTVSLALFIFTMVIGVAALVPYAFSFGFNYFSLTGEQGTTDGVLSDADKDMVAQSESFMSVLVMLDPKKIKDATLFSDLVALLTSEKPSEVVLTAFIFSKDGETRKKLTVSGVSNSREALVVFSKKLSENKIFSSVDLPISNLSKKTNIDFSITLTMGKK